MTVEEFAAMIPTMRREYVQLPIGKKWLATLNEDELDEVGRLLCHASALVERKRNPIIGDSSYKTSVEQEAFEESIFGNQSKRGDLPVE